MKNFLLAIMCLIFMAGCIGTDLVDDPVVGEKIEIMPDRIALLIGTSTIATAMYYNQFGVVEPVNVLWSASPSSIASVTQSGLINAMAPGQAMLFATYGGLTDSVRVVVVLNENAAASVNIEPSKTSLTAGETVNLTATVRNIDDDIITTAAIEWISNDETIATVSSNGAVTAIGNGIVTINAIADGVYSNDILLMVGEASTTKLMGTFVSANGYLASGMAALSNENGDLILTFSENFMTSFALGTFIYLANNNSSGTSIRSQGIELGQITMNGSHSFNVTSKFPNVTAAQHKYVIVLCKPASLVFGFAELK